MKDRSLQALYAIVAVCLHFQGVWAFSSKQTPVAAVIPKISMITRVHEDQGSMSDRLIFHFSGKPVCTHIPRDADNTQKGESARVTFFVPLATIKEGSVRQAINKLNKRVCKTDYCLRIKTVTTPMKGVEFEVTFDPDRASLEYQSFTSITGEPCLMFQFHDHSKLKKIKKALPDTIRRTAQLHKPVVVLDYGHGGVDDGFTNGIVKEKDINRAIGLQLLNELKKKGIRSV